MKVRARVKTELAQLETAIETYKEKRGYYPPDNPAPRPLTALPADPPPYAPRQRMSLWGGLFRGAFFLFFLHKLASSEYMR